MGEDSGDEAELQTVLDALDDPDCRAIVTALDEPKTAQELMTDCDLSQTSTYRKLDLLTEAGLVEESVAIREDGHHETQYSRAFAGILIGLTDEDLFDVTTVEERESSADRLARLWSEVGEEL